MSMCSRVPAARPERSRALANFDSDMVFGVQHVSAIAEMHALGQMAGTNDVVEKITCRKPQTVAEFVEKHRAAWQ